MSIFNMMLPGGDNGFKTATAITVTSTALTFLVDSEPAEYLVMWDVTTDTAIGPSNQYVGFFYDLDDSDAMGFNYYTYQQAKFRLNMLYISKSYSSGQLTLTLTSSSLAFDANTQYIIYYR